MPFKDLTSFNKTKLSSESGTSPFEMSRETTAAARAAQLFLENLLGKSRECQECRIPQCFRGHSTWKPRTAQPVRTSAECSAINPASTPHPHCCWRHQGFAMPRAEAGEAPSEPPWALSTAGAGQQHCTDTQAEHTALGSTHSSSEL